jgi:hypothetical protein
MARGSRPKKRKSQWAAWDELQRRRKLVTKLHQKLIKEMGKIEVFLNKESQKSRSATVAADLPISAIGSMRRKSKVTAPEGVLNKLLKDTEDVVRWELMRDEWSKAASAVDTILEELIGGP